MIIETSLLIKNASKQKESKDGKSYYTVLTDISTNDRDFGMITRETRVSSDLDLSAVIGKKQKCRIEIYYSQKSGLGLKIVEII